MRKIAFVLALVALPGLAAAALAEELIVHDVAPGIWAIEGPAVAPRRQQQFGRAYRPISHEWALGQPEASGPWRSVMTLSASLPTSSCRWSKLNW